MICKYKNICLSIFMIVALASCQHQELPPKHIYPRPNHVNVIKKAKETFTDVEEIQTTTATLDIAVDDIIETSNAIEKEKDIGKIKTLNSQLLTKTAILKKNVTKQKETIKNLSIKLQDLFEKIVKLQNDRNILVDNFETSQQENKYLRTENATLKKDNIQKQQKYEEALVWKRNVIIIGIIIVLFVIISLIIKMKTRMIL